MRDPNELFDNVRACAAILGSNLEEREIEGGLTAKVLLSSISIVPIDAFELALARFTLGSNRLARSGEGGLAVNISSAPSSSFLEPKLLYEDVRLCGGCPGSSKYPDPREPGREACSLPSRGYGELDREPPEGKGTE